MNYRLIDLSGNERARFAGLPSTETLVRTALELRPEDAVVVIQSPDERLVPGLARMGRPIEAITLGELAATFALRPSEQSTGWLYGLVWLELLDQGWNLTVDSSSHQVRLAH
jgi:hypothetical protein